jgi:probable F420-dependent oxidoreductase
MKFGIALKPELERPNSFAQTFVEVAQNASEMGYQALWTSHRPTVRSTGEDTLAPLIALASLVHVVPDMLLGVNIVVLPLLDAVVIANQAATFSRLSGERFILGIGVGGNEAEYQRLGAAYTSRGRRADEAIAVMRRLWREERVDFTGEFYSLGDLAINPRPKGGHPPLWIGGRSAAAIDRAASVGDAWAPALVDPRTLGAGVARLRQGLAGRPMPTIASAEFVHPLRSRDEALQDRVHVAGTPEEMIATLRAYEMAGLDHLVCHFVAANMDEQLSQMRLFAEGVMPTFSE